jgi:hypothetical protein
MNETISHVTLRIAVACCVLAGCGAGDPPAAGTALTVDSIAGDSVFDPSEERVNLPSSSIYYTLTSYDWYARGESLVHEGRPYEPEGMPVNFSLSEMSHVGEYKGVEYYVHGGEAEAAVYVPVFEGYWQRFRADPSARAMPTDADVDSTDAATDSVADRV